MSMVITGASGLLGRSLMKQFAHESPVGWAYSRAKSGLMSVDLCDERQVGQALDQIQPDIIIHAAAERRPDVSAASPEQAMALNVQATQQLATKAQQLGAQLVYISTDYVFDGQNAPYQEDDQPNPINFYGESKLKGEQALIEAHEHAVILRVPVMYGPVEYWGESAITSLVALLDAPEGKVDHHAIRFPTHVDDVSAACQVLVQHMRTDTLESGIYHRSAKAAYTKYEMVQIMGDLLGRSYAHLLPEISPPTDGVQRPYNCHLACKKLEALGVASARGFKQGIAEILKA